ncbi:MAG TPA: AAA family ATPase [Candidatus Limnocylindria bacterium]|nr:AAA family ATPase [Candidatus Limnocylindria bacterium]
MATTADTSKTGAPSAAQQPTENIWAPKPLAAAPPTATPAATSASPIAPATLEETGLTQPFVADLALKLLYQKGQCTAQELADSMCLPLAKIVQPILDWLKNEHHVEVKGGSGVAASTYQYVLATKGIERAREAMARNGYVGPAPVTVQAYVARVKTQSMGDLQISFDQLRKALSHLVLPEHTIRQLGPAINSGKSIFLFGPPGTGKSSIANALASLLQGGMVLPYAILVGQQVIRVYDVSHHRPLVQLDARYDRRWVPVARPFVEVGGELTLEDLDLVVDPSSKVHEAPFQMKASGGILLIDDFGRQRVAPDELLNRWIVPLDRDVDYLTMSDGRKIEVPFDVLLVFSTNRTPSSLVDEAFLRRIQYKIEVKPPTDQEFSEILRRVCETQGLAFHPKAAEWIAAYAHQRNIALRSCQPRDLMRHVASAARFLQKPAELSPELVQLACETYFVAL